MISSVAWVRKAIAKQKPDQFVMDEDEYQRICEMAKEKLTLAEAEKADFEQNQEREQLEGDASQTVMTDASTPPAAEGDDDDDEIIKEFGLDTYEQEVTEQDFSVFDTLGKGLAEYQNNDEDPHLTLKDEDYEDEEAEEAMINPTDNILLVGKTEDDVSHLEVYVYDFSQDNLYVHHDIMLPSFPLAIEPINFNFGNGGKNYCAIGTFSPEIEIWNLDQVDVMYPHMILGEAVKQSKKSKKKKVQKPPTALPQGHTDAVLSLSWNQQVPNFLASSSADGLILIWDLSRTEKHVVQCLRHHQDKVSTIAFHPQHATTLLSGSYDRTVCLSDVRASEPALRWKLDSDIECVAWDPFNINGFVVGCDDGSVRYFDARQVSAPLFTLAAHSSSITSVSLNANIPGLMMTSAATSSEMLKLWDITDNQPTMLGHRDVGAGKVLAAQFCPDEAYLTAIGGSTGVLSVWNVTENKSVRQRFHKRKVKLSDGQEHEVRMDLPGALGIDKVIDDNNAMEMDDDDASSSGDFDEVVEEMKGVRSSST